MRSLESRMGSVSRSPARRGFALPAAIGALVVVGMLVTVGFYVTSQEMRIGAESRFSAMAANLAQSGTNGVLVHRTRDFMDLPVWGDTTLVDTLDGGIVSVDVTRMASRMFFMDATAIVTEDGALWSGARSRVGVITRMSRARLAPRAALTTNARLGWSGRTVVQGIDAYPDGAEGGVDWSTPCATMERVDAPGILAADTARIAWGGARVSRTQATTGSPAVAQDAQISFASLSTLGDMEWDQVAQLAEELPSGAPGPVAPATRDGRCDSSDPANWGSPGDPESPCFDYFPILHRSGRLELTGGAGQGILLVDGDLDVSGGFAFYGPVFVRGRLTTRGEGAHFWGGVVVADPQGRASTLGGSAAITYSSCAIQRAILNNPALTKVRPLAMRSWVDLSDVSDG